MYARGTIFGLTRGTNKYHLTRAAFESVAYQCKDVINAISEDTGIKFSNMKVDGGGSASDFLMQFQSDIINLKIIRPKITETTALGAACLAGLTVGFYGSKNEFANNYIVDKSFSPSLPQNDVELLTERWSRALSSVLKIY
jgi:glycerol kinase